MLVDADDQRTATDFAALRNQQGEGLASYTSIQLSGKAVREQVLKLKNKFDYIIIDTGGRDTTSLSSRNLNDQPFWIELM